MSHLFLTGFMGAGKTTVGRAVAGLLGRPFIDLDEAIEKREGASVTALFERIGEQGFRDAEHAALTALAGEPDAVVATGGGVVLRDDNRIALRAAGTVVYLAVTPAEALARLGGADDRPLLAGRGIAAATEILAARLALYEATADHVVDTGGRAVAEVADAIARLALEPPTEVICVGRGSDAYDVVIGTGLIDEVGPRIRDVLGVRSVAVVTDDVVGPLFRRRVVPSLAAAGIRTSEHTVPSGERSKSWERAGALLERFAASGLDRSSAVVALGGGVVGDLAGFCAATYMRGIPVVQVPTTLLAQVDSAIGGKTAVDLDAGKNLAGAFWPPALVISDVAALETLPEGEWVNGLVEVVKTALLAGEGPLGTLERDLDAVLARDHASVTRAVTDAAAFKASIVSADERESGVRECLNLGHTLGHALESVAGYGAVPHGVAVAEGLRFAGMLAEEIVGAEPGLTRRTAALLERVGAPPLRLRLDTAALMAAMRSDKKSRDGVVRFVLLAAPGSWSVHEVADATLEAAVVRWAARITGEGS